MSTTISISLNSETAKALSELAIKHGLTPEEAAEEAIKDHLDVATRYRAAVGRIETIDQSIHELAAFLGEATANGGGELDLSQICRASCVQVKP